MDVRPGNADAAAATVTGSGAGRRGGPIMQATVGDRLVVRGHNVGEHDRIGEIIEIGASDGTPPYTVRWDEDGHVGLVFPGPDATVRPAAVPAAARHRRPRRGGRP